MKLKYSLLLAALAASLFGVPALAASTATSGSSATGSGTGIGIGGGNAVSNSNSGSYSGSTSTGGSATGGAAAGTVNFTYNGDPAGAGGDPASTETINGTQRLVTVGTAIAPSIYNNNLCALGASAAAGFMGGAFALGFDRVDKGCDLRATASLLGHFAEIYSIQAEHAPDPAIRARAEQAAITYATWADNLLCMQNPELAAAAPPGSNVCHTVATQQGMQVVPAPVAYAVVPAPQPPRPIVAAVADPPPKPVYAGPHVYATHEVVPSSMRSGPISGYQGPDYSDD